MKQLGMFAEGGSVTDDRFVESALDKMSDMQLAQAEQAAIMRNDTKRIAQIAEEKATRASERRGLAGAFNQIPPDQRESMTQMARGGILAFAIGGDKGKEYYDDARGTESDAIDAPALFSPGYYLRSISEAPKPRTQEEIQQAATQRAASLGELYGKSALTPFAADIAKEREALTGQKEQNKGLVALAAAQALSRAPGLRAGLGEMFGAIGTESARLNKELQSSQRLLRQSEMELARADQARKDGQVGLAIQLENQADRDKTAAFERERAAKLNMAKLAQSAVTERGRTQLQKELAQQRIDATLEAARISAGRPGETVLAMREATAAFEAQGMNPADAKTKAVEAVLGRGSVTDWSRLTESYVQRELAKDPTIKDDPVRLAEVRALAGDKAATTLKGYGVKEAMGLEKALLEDEELKSLRLRRSGISNTPANADRLRSINESIKRREDEIRSGFTSSAPPSTPPAARPVAVRSATESVMSDTEKAEAREWLRKNPNDPRAARVRAALGE
jgi:hypothetical protein